MIGEVKWAVSLSHLYNMSLIMTLIYAIIDYIVGAIIKSDASSPGQHK